MTLPLLAKTWQGGSVPGGTDFLSNLIPGAGLQKATLLAIKEALVNFNSSPWTVAGSSDSLVAGMDAVDRWADVGDLVWASTAGTVFSWIVLEQAALNPGKTFQLLISLEILAATDGNREDIAINYSWGLGFTGGSTTVSPTATDGRVPSGPPFTLPNWIGAESGAPTDKMLSCIQSIDGECTRIIISNEATAKPIALWSFEVPKDPDPDWIEPIVIQLGRVTVGGGTSVLDWQYQELEVWGAHNAVNVRNAQPMISSSEIVDEPQATGNPRLYPAQLCGLNASGQAHVGGPYGSLFDWYWVSRNVTGAHMLDLDTAPAAGDRTFVCVGDMMIGWLDDSATDLLYDFTIQAPQFISSEIGAHTSGFPQVTLLKPAGTQPGDVLLFFHYGAGFAAHVTSEPSGFVNHWDVNQFQDGSLGYFYCSHKIAGYGEPSSYQWNLTGGADDGLAALLCYRPAHGTQLEVINGQIMGNPAGSHTAANVTTVNAEATIVAAYMFNRQGSNTHSVTTPPAGMNSREDFNGSAISRPDLGLAIYDEEKAVAGLYTGKTLLSNPSTYGYGITAALRALGT